MSKQGKTKQQILEELAESRRRIEELEALRDKLTHKNSEAKYRSIFDRAPISITVVNKEGVIVDVNPFHLNKVLNNKLTYEQYVGQNLLLDPGLQQAGVIEAHKRTLQGETMDLQDVSFPPSKLGPALVANVRGVPIIEQGKVEGAVFILEVITERKRLQEEMRQANEKLTGLVRKFERQNHFTGILIEMRNLLQSCSNIAEIGPVIMSSMVKLYPEATGALFLLSPSRSDLESVVKWGEFPEDVDENVFAPDSCWGLRRGRAHVVLDKNIGPACAHLKQMPRGGYVCLPLIAKSDVLGLLHLRITDNVNAQNAKQLVSDLQDTTLMLSEYLSLAIANVKLTESLALQSTQDPLSGMFNRRFLEEFLQHEILRAARKKNNIGIIMADLDYFKNFNDQYGHMAGDKLISDLGRFFKKRIRESDIACRYGGEEFVLVLPESPLKDTYKRAEEIREELKKIEFAFQGQYLGSLTISMGVATFPDNGSNFDELIRAADVAMYRAKQGGRDRVVVSDSVNLERPLET